MWTELPDILPASRGEPEPGAAGVTPGQRLQPRVLLLDDDPFMLAMQSRMLSSMGYPTIVTVGSAAAALLRLRRDPLAVDVILCDLNMPGMDGIEFLQKLTATQFRGNIILLSGEGLRIMHTVQRLLGNQLVILGVLEKPAGRAALQALLDCWEPVGAAALVCSVLDFTAAELHAAHQKREWVLHYQPKVDMKTGALAGVEALVRWNHPEHGLVYPDRFIGMVEDCGAIDALTDWVLQAAVEQQARWLGAGMSIHMAVNISMENLRSPDFVRRVNAIVHHSGMSPRDVVLEVTESRLMSPSPVPLENLIRLRMQRFGLSIDDFGTGHSSLAQLRDVPFTELKIDRGFVHGARHNQVIRPMLEGSIGIAKRLDMLSVAEGVESLDDWQLLREIGCDLAQGYFIGRPMPGERVPEWLSGWRSRRADLVGS
jgi:EAL domain-containing protein (putative c-di-GMP-specific phosphodiesterase class I)